MTSIIFILAYIASLIFSTLYISPYFIIIWLLTSYIIAFLTVIVYYLLNFPIVLLLKPTHPYKTYLMKSLSCFLNKFVLNLKVEIKGLENIPNEGSIVAYSNHKSYTDAFAIMQYFPRSITLTPKKSVLKIPLFRLWLKAYAVFPINRNNPRETLKDLDKAIKTVRSNHTILIFPEGSIKDRNNDKVLNAKAGSFRLVKLAEAGILPIRIEGNDLVRKRWPLRTKRKIIFYPIISYKTIEQLNTQEISKMYMDTINN